MLPEIVTWLASVTSMTRVSLPSTGLKMRMKPLPAATASLNLSTRSSATATPVAPSSGVDAAASSAGATSSLTVMVKAWAVLSPPPSVVRT